MLNLGVAEVADRRLVAEAPEVALRNQIEGVPEADGPAEEVGVRLGEGDHLLLAVEGRARGRRHRGDERRGARERGQRRSSASLRFCEGRAGDSLVRRRASPLGRCVSLSAPLALAPPPPRPQRVCWSQRSRSDPPTGVMSAAAHEQTNHATPPPPQPRRVMLSFYGVPWANENRCWPNARGIAVLLEVWIEAIISAIRGPRSMKLRRRPRSCIELKS